MKEHRSDNDQNGIAAVLAAFMMINGDDQLSPGHAAQAEAALKKARMFLEERPNWENGDGFIKRVVKARTYREGLKRLTDYMAETDRWDTLRTFAEEDARYIEWWRKKKAAKRKASGKKGAAKKWKKV